MRAWDSSPFRNHGTLVGVIRKGWSGITLNGTNKITCNDLPASLLGDTPKTVEAWVIPTAGAVTLNNFAVAIAAPNTNQSILLGIRYDAGAIRGLLSTAGGANDLKPNPLSGGQYIVRHLIGQYLAPNEILYVDGMQTGVKNLTSTNTGTPTMTIGAHSSGENFTGQIMMVRVWTRYLSPLECSSIHNNPYEMFLK
jgi:hypothetical protein